MARSQVVVWFLLLAIPLVVPKMIAVGNRNDMKNMTELDCAMRSLALEYAAHIFAGSEWQSLLKETLPLIQDALRLQALDCPMDDNDDTYPSHHLSESTTDARRTSSAFPCSDDDSWCIFVSPNASYVDGDGSRDNPVTSLHLALEKLQELREQHRSIKQHGHVVLRQGTHFLPSTLMLSKEMSNLKIMAYPREDVWISGGKFIGGDDDAVVWEPCQTCITSKILVANLTDFVKDLPGGELPNLVSIFTGTSRYIRARYPNSNPEVDQWGYASRDRLRFSIPSSNVLEWHRPPANASNLPSFVLYDFSHEPLPDNLPVGKNDSVQAAYNMYASGKGGVCASIWGDHVDSYWCSNFSSGGWAEVDREAALTGQLGIPIGLTYNTSTERGKHLARGESHHASHVGGIVHAWHSQSWSMHMFEVQKHDNKTGEIHFVPGGGRQGGRNWCRCDQCTYAGPWCKQHENEEAKDTRLIGGSWIIENSFPELDQPGEFFFDKTTKQLYLYPNATTDIKDLRVAVLDRLIELSHGAHNITIENVGFQDMKATYMDEWAAPSGGDWALHRGGAVFLENTTSISIRGCRFSRLDGNAIFLSGRTRNTTIEGCHFEWLGENAIATWGHTRDYDATGLDIPLFTTIRRNVFRELGIYQKQSSALGQCKAAFTTVEKNIMFNTPRAAINFNDMVGGGDLVRNNLIFNTCRESGDHGPINSWDRQPYLTQLRDGTLPSFKPVERIIESNFIWANYGASQGVDTDDGSSWFIIRRNVFYMADGAKMDYGGHDSRFEDNLVLSVPYDGAGCYNLDGFFLGHGHVVKGNTCVMGLGNPMGSGCGDPSCASSQPAPDKDTEIVGTLWPNCETNNASLLENRYFTPSGRAMVSCGGRMIPLNDLQHNFRLESGSTVGPLPTANVLYTWSRMLLLQTPGSTVESQAL